MDAIEKHSFELGAFTVHPNRNILIRDGVEHTLEPRVMDVLCVLASKGQDVCARQELIDRIWAVEFGADEGLTRAISVLRRTIREAGEADPYVETIPKRGYRLAKTVKALSQDDSAGEHSRPIMTADAAAALREPVDRQFAGGAAARPASNGSGWKAYAAALAGVFLIGAVAAFAMLRDSRGAAERAPIAAVAADASPSIAVLPFRPLTENPSDLHFGDGVAEELLHLLARIPELKVAARTSSFAFRGDQTGISEIGRTLNVDHVLEGSIRRSGTRIRVTAQLIRVQDGFHVWTETYDRELHDIFEVQDDITRQISQALQIRLGVGFARNLDIHPSVDPAAVELYFRGIYFWGNRMNVPSAQEDALAALRAAVEIDEDFAAAWAMIGYLGTNAGGGPLARDREAFTAMIVEALDRALEIDPDQPLAHAAMARWSLQSDLDIDKALFHFQRASELSPNTLNTLDLSASITWLLGDTEATFLAYRKGLALDPLSDLRKLSLALRFAEVGRFAEAFVILDACHQARCAGEGFVAFATTAAYMSGDEAILARWRPIALEFLALLERTPDSRKPRSTDLLPALFAVWFDLPDKAEKMDAAIERLQRDPITDSFGIWGPTFARYAPPDLIMDLMELAHERGDLFSAAFGLSPYYGFNSYPEEILQHPRYISFWRRPELAKVAALRIRNNQPIGLPDGL